ncbi:sister chromatid cohesion protein PDS5 homolog B isoform X3 [Neodiprion pinetum]|uniref:Sister chromatid cohesion protein PDS5 homolog B-B isoform X3 n=1 Tax=Neodiprion lecontei TaxID=441921 RepID=A0ABM3FN07_NEOLC|nr:sister chromatid cohesion protein PDS5 homolog B-B isoform X3 [Neodiprion fabricii]XP_046471203.1 sister chromatid cohesion protein PDS5 homolog B-B isoform X3 [Neodiprion pinetum]XP_046589388.1 sister chromatid cohesion protein PDS5 homolog B-B isoform X3 [Neodiprion lecontei]
MSEIVYPQGCRSVTEDLGPDELIRRLKTLAHTLQAMGQDEGMYQQYIPLALHLAEDHFLMHQSKDVQLLIACCIADVLRVYAPEAPYKDADQVKTIFLFLIKQLSGLKDPKDPAFKRYFYLLENLAYVKSFNMCFELEDCQEIFCALFSLMFKIVNDEHSGKVKSFMLDVLCPLITESDIVGNELLDIILMNIVEPNKTQKKNAYLLAKELVIKCSDTLEPYIQAFFNHVLILGKEEKGLQICKKVYDLIYELNHICPSVLLSVLPQLECKLKSSLENERLGAVALLARMFSEKGSQLAIQHTQLWRAFLGRFNDISVSIRIKCVQYSMHFLLNHSELRKDITDTLKLRQHDADESVRYEVVMAIVTTARRDFEVVSDSEDLLEFVKERTLDKKFKIRKEAMSGLAMIYKKHLNDADVPQATKKAVTWIKDKILHGYYMAGMEDRLLVERLLNTCLVPYQLSPEERMKKLYHLLGTIDDHASKAFVELQKHQLAVRRSVVEWVEITKKPESPSRDRDLLAKVSQISRFLPDPMKAQEFLQKFSLHMKKDPTLLQGMETIVQPNVTCKECAETTSLVLKKLGQPVMTNLYYNTIKMLLERVSSVMIDEEAIRVLIGYVLDCLKGGNVIEEVGLNPNNAGEKGLRLLVIVKELLVKENSEQTTDVIEGDWCREDQLPEETRCRLEALKCMARWLLGLKSDVLSAQKTFRMLNAFVVNKGDLLQQGRLSRAEMSWLRLQAGCSMLKICEQKGVGDQFTAEQFYNLSQLMVDEVPQVREAFGGKLHKGLGRGIPNKCLPLDFMGYYALAGKEQDKRLKYLLKTYMQTDINKRRDYVKTLSLGTVDKAMGQLPHILPDYMLVFAVPILAHDPEFTNYNDVSQLKVIQQCLWYILEPLITKNEFYCYGFYKNLIERMKSHKDALKPEDDNVNYKLWAVCDLAMNVIFSKTTNFDLKEFPSETRIPTMYFKKADELLVNSKNYLPAEMQVNMSSPKAKGLLHNTHMGNDRPQRRTKSKQQKEVGIGPNETDARLQIGEMECIDAQPAEASETRIQLPGLDDEIEEPPAKRMHRDSDKINLK